MNLFRSICVMLSFTLLFQAIGCQSIHTLKTLNEAEIRQYEPEEGVFVRLNLKPEAELPFKERRITCRIVEVDPETLTIKSVGVPGIDTRNRFEIRIEDIQKMEILQEKLSGARVGFVVLLVFVVYVVIGIAALGGMGRDTSSNLTRTAQ